MNDDQHISSAGSASIGGRGTARGRPAVAIGLFVFFIAMLGYGVTVGNVFDNYENASNL
jgi:hypothetical protein